MRLNPELHHGSVRDLRLASQGVSFSTRPCRVSHPVIPPPPTPRTFTVFGTHATCIPSGCHLSLKWHQCGDAQGGMSPPPSPSFPCPPADCCAHRHGVSLESPPRAAVCSSHCSGIGTTASGGRLHNHPLLPSCVRSGNARVLLWLAARCPASDLTDGCVCCCRGCTCSEDGFLIDSSDGVKVTSVRVSRRMVDC